MPINAWLTMYIIHMSKELINVEKMGLLLQEKSAK